jgi:hypothetical protein
MGFLGVLITIPSTHRLRVVGAPAIFESSFLLVGSFASLLFFFFHYKHSAEAALKLPPGSVYRNDE